MHTDKSRQNPWALTSNTVFIEIQTFCLQRRCFSFTKKWLTSSVIPTLGNWCLGNCQIVKTVQKYTVLTILIIRYWNSEPTEQFALGAMRGENKIISCFQRFSHFIWRTNFRLLFKLDTFASTYSRDLLPHTRGANGFRDRGHGVQSFSAKWRQAALTPRLRGI